MNFTGKRTQRIWLTVYLSYLAILTLSPYRFSLDRLRELGQFAPRDLLFELIYMQFDDMVVNLVLFLPLGFLFFYWKGMKLRFWLQAFIAGGLISLTVEFLQLFVQRSTNGMDILMNATGSAAGFFLAAVYYRTLQDSFGRRSKVVRTFRWMVLVFYSAAVVWLCLLPRKCSRPDGWKSWYPLLLGNELTLDRPWAGDLYRVTLFSRALTGKQIRVRFAGGPGFEDSTASGTCIADYRFDEGGGNTVYDHSGTEPLLNLTGDPVQWLPGGGIRCGEGYVKSPGDAGKVTEAVTASNAMSVEVWCRPDNLVQGGPARIVTLSPDASRRNFSLAQEGRQIHLRFRSHLGGENGSVVNLRAENALTGIDRVHLVATVHQGVQQLYVNGHRHPDVIYGHISYLPQFLGLAKKMRSVPGQISLLFCLFFPFGLLISAIRGRPAWAGTAVFVLLLISGIDLYFVLGSGAPVCVLFYISGLVSAWAGVLVFRETQKAAPINPT